MEKIQVDEKKELSNETNALNILNLAYKVNKNELSIRLFGERFVDNNKDNFKLFINEKEVDFSDVYPTDQIDDEINILKVTLKEMKPVTDYSYLFFKCDSLLYFYNADKFNLSHVPDISTWDTSNIVTMDSLFFNCQSLLEAPDISNWNTKNVTTLNGFFGDCYALKEIPDISGWDTRNVTDMGALFVKCIKLEKLPDISQWKTGNVTEMTYMFYKCKSLKSLPDISVWDTSKVRDIFYMFANCRALESLPEISK